MLAKNNNNNKNLKKKYKDKQELLLHSLSIDILQIHFIP